MTVNAMKPTFTDRESYKSWRSLWATVYARSTEEIRREKAALKVEQRKASLLTGEALEAQNTIVSKLARNLRIKQVIAWKMNTLLEEAKQRRDRILGMRQSLDEQMDSFPLSISKCRNIDLHFNKISIEFDFMPMWTLKAQGKSFYINHIESLCPWNTRELPEGSTRGMIRLKNCDIHIDKGGTATLTPYQVELNVAA